MTFFTFLKMQNMLDSIMYPTFPIKKNTSNESKNDTNVINTSNNDTSLYISEEQIRQTKLCIPKYYISQNILHGTDFSTFFYKCRKFGLSISNIEMMNPGETIEVVFIHDKILHDIKKKIYTNTLYTPKEIFEEYKVSYTKIYGLQGNVDRYNSNIQIFELYVEMYNIWFPTKDGKIQYNHKTIHWKDLPLDTKVGLQGIMIPWKILALYPSKIYLI